MTQNEVWEIKQKITGVLIREARLNAGKSLKECGEILSVSSSTVSAIERGNRSISLPELEMLAYYLNVPLDHLLNGSSKTTSTPAEEWSNSELLTLRHRIVGALLRQARLDVDLNQTELAERIGVSQRKLSQYEHGESPIPLVELEAMAKILDVPMAYFLDEGIGPIGEQQRREREWQQFSKLSSEVRTFVLEPSNLGYLELAMSLSSVPANKLRNIAASLLDITL